MSTADQMRRDYLARSVYLIWSNEHRAWWAPRRNGYTGDYFAAGRYSRAEAIEICKRALPGSHVGVPNEIPISTDDMAEVLWDEINASKPR